jgi:hypothetical protein
VAIICAPRSTARVPFQTPFIILPLTRGGGGSRIEHAGFDDLYWGTRFYRQDWIPDPLCLSTFNKGGGGGGSGMGDFVWVPLSSPHDCLHLSPSTICLPLYISPPLSAILAHLIPISTSYLSTPVPLLSTSLHDKQHVLPRPIMSHHHSSTTSNHVPQSSHLPPCLIIKSFSQSRWQRERASTSQECRVDRGHSQSQGSSY